MGKALAGVAGLGSGRHTAAGHESAGAATPKDQGEGVSAKGAGEHDRALDARAPSLVRRAAHHCAVAPEMVYRRMVNTSRLVQDMTTPAADM